MNRKGDGIRSVAFMRRALALLCTLMLCISGVLSPNMTAKAAGEPTLPNATRIDNEEYIAFRDASDDYFKNTLWIQNVTACRGDAEECRKTDAEGALMSKTYSVAYCLNKSLSMPYDMEEKMNNDEMSWDPDTGLWTGAQKYWRFEPADRLVKTYVKNETGKDANLRKIRKVLYYGYHDDDSSEWQKEHGVSDLEFREATQLALWYYTDKFEEPSSWPFKGERDAFYYLIDTEDKLPDAPVDFQIRFYHTDEKNDDGEGYQNLVSSVRESIPTPPIKERTKVTFKKYIQGTQTPLSGVTLKVYAVSKTEGDGSVLFEKEINLDNTDNAFVEVEQGVKIGRAHV